ncbi:MULTISPECIES: S24 family peptidase [unclassified Chryseobacterium]|uniref:LexA family transcriptional regulator n=1 Tax=unclassified Chryseobacterium TaxID=2593645 RepID=UPI001622DA29|nr:MULTISPECIES: S24 family peptidase [unclassified Chryseobacterium]
MDNTLILNEIKSYYNLKSDSDFAKFLDIKPQTLSNWKSRNSIDYSVISTKCVEIDANWLLTGKGNMLKNANLYAIEERFHHSKSMESDISYGNTVPLYDLEATAGVFEVFTKNPQSVPIDHITIPNLPKCDGALYIRGDSMYPLLKSGDIVAYKTIQDKYNIIWGEMYLIYLEHNGDEYFFCKFLKKSSREGYIELISHNQHHQSTEFPVESIKALALVKASVRFNTLY